MLWESGAHVKRAFEPRFFVPLPSESAGQPVQHVENQLIVLRRRGLVHPHRPSIRPGQLGAEHRGLAEYRHSAQPVLQPVFCAEASNVRISLSNSMAMNNRTVCLQDPSAPFSGTSWIR